MGMYADICDNEIKFTGLTAKAICQAKGIAQVDSIVEITRTEVSDVLTEINSMLSNGLPIVEDGNITAHRCINVSKVARFAALLVDWLVNTSEDSIVFA